MTRSNAHLVFSRSQQRARPAQGGRFADPVYPEGYEHRDAHGRPLMADGTVVSEVTEHARQEKVRAVLDSMARCISDLAVVAREVARPNGVQGYQMKEPTFPVMQGGPSPESTAAAVAKALAWRVRCGMPPTGPAPSIEVKQEYVCRELRDPSPGRPVDLEERDEELERERARLVGKLVRRTARSARKGFSVGPTAFIESVTRGEFIDRPEGNVLAWVSGGSWVRACDVEPIPEAPPAPTKVRAGDLAVGDQFKVYAGTHTWTVVEHDLPMRQVVAQSDAGVIGRLRHNSEVTRV